MRYCILVVAPLLGLAPSIAPASDLFVSSYGTGVVSKYTTTGTPINLSLVTTPVTNPGALAVVGNDLFVLNYPDGKLGKYTTSGDVVNSSLVSMGALNPLGIAVSNSMLYVTNGSQITVITTSGTVTNPALVSGLPRGSYIAASDTDLFVAFNVAGAIGKYSITGQTANDSFITNLGVSEPTGIAVSGGYLFISNYFKNTISEYTTDGLLVNASLITGLNGPETIAIDGSDLYVANYLGHTVGKYTLGSSPGTISAAIPALISGLNSPQAVAVSSTVPEPASLALFLGGIAALVHRRRSHPRC